MIKSSGNSFSIGSIFISEKFIGLFKKSALLLFVVNALKQINKIKYNNVDLFIIEK
jgi:hypothetical protein